MAGSSGYIPLTQNKSDTSPSQNNHNIEGVEHVPFKLDLDDELGDDVITNQDRIELEAFDFIEELASAGPAQGTSDMKMAFMNMANSILGAGIIGQPFAFKNCGLIGGIVVMVFLTFLIDWTLRLIVINAELSNTNLYQDFVYKCYGKWGKIVLLVSISFFAYGGCMAFCVIIGDTIPHVLKAMLPASITGPQSAISWVFSRNFIIVFFTGCVSYPLSLNRDISKLAKASGLALVGMSIIVVITVCRAPFIDNSLRTPLTVPEWTINSNIFQGISVISFALVCHHNTIYIYNSLRNATVDKFSKITHIACGISMIFCGVMGINGLLVFGDDTKGNILNNFKSSDNWINLARFCFGLNMLTTFPLEIYVVRDVIKEVILASKSEDGTTSHLELNNRQHIAITSVLVFSSMTVSLFTCNLGIILELIGATSASLMAYILPPLCYFKLSWSEHNSKGNASMLDRDFLMWKAIPSISCVTFGFVLMVFSTIGSLTTPGSGEQCVID
jgi:sodium-coupled neutral amino acid transporter 11